MNTNKNKDMGSSISIIPIKSDKFFYPSFGGVSNYEQFKY